MNDIDDAELVVRAQSSDVAAVGALYDRHHQHIYRYIWIRLESDSQAEDLTSEVFARMLANLPDYEITDIPFRAWLYRIARNLLVDHYRSQNGRVAVPLFLAEGMGEVAGGPDEIVEQKLTLAQIKEALERIDDRQREVVVLRFLVGLSLKEVAHTLDKSVAAVKSLQHRGLATLRLVVQQEAPL